MVETRAPEIRRLLAPNPSPMTYTGTNTYLLGLRDIAVIDPGPDHDAHFAAILAAIGPSQKITKILVTHSHLDHAPLARRLSAHCGAPVYAYGDSGAGRRPQMIAISEAGSIGGGEGVDYNFQPDITLEDGAVLDHEGQELIAVWTPGHFGNHMAFSWNEAVFSGDHVMAWASTMISPPDGDLGAFRRSCSKLQLRSERLYLPGHGDAIEDGGARARTRPDAAAAAHGRGRRGEGARGVEEELVRGRRREHRDAVRVRPVPRTGREAVE